MTIVLVKNPIMPSPREQMILTAATLFQRDGYRSTSWRKLVQESGAPWGSAHHYFPGGKEQLGVAAIGAAAQSVADLITHSFAGGGAAEGVTCLFAASAGRLERSGFNAGCPVTTVALETVPESPAMTTACRDAFTLWLDTLAGELRRCGLADDRAAAQAMAVLSMFEGSLILARVSQSVEPMRAGAAVAAGLLADDLGSAVAADGGPSGW